MRNSSKSERENLVLEILADKGINYFSYTLFVNDKAIISHCNNFEWLQFYNEKYGLFHSPPVQKYILSSKQRILCWNLLSFDKEAVDFIKKRGDVVNTCSNISLIGRRNNSCTVITLGTAKNNDYLMNFVRNNPEILLSINETFMLW